MKRFILQFSVALYLCGIFFVSCSDPGGSTKEAQQPEEEQQPNVLFIAVDDLRPELGCFGKSMIKSPNIDRLASEGLSFDRSYCNIPVCGASRSSILTGLRPTRDRFIHYYTRIAMEAPDVVTLPEYFRENGYHTISNGKITHHAYDAKRSWDEEWRMEAKDGGSWRDYQVPENIKLERENKRGPAFEAAELPDTAYFDGKTAQKTIQDLRRMKKEGKKFFLACGFLKPHLPFNAPIKYWDMYDSTQIKLPDNNYKPKGAPDEAMHNWGELRSYYNIPKRGPLTDAMARRLIHGYYACVTYTDAQIGAVLNELDRLDLRKNTIVILWGDHGWNLREHGLWCKHCNFETSLHAPIIISAPGGKNGIRTSEITEYVDIYPTLCDLAGLQKPEHLEGSSFAHILSDPNGKTDGIAVCRWTNGLTLIKDNYFYTEWINRDDSEITRMLYNHDVDPHENINISELPENQKLIEQFSQLIKENRGKDFDVPMTVEYNK